MPTCSATALATFNACGEKSLAAQLKEGLIASHARAFAASQNESGHAQLGRCFTR